MKLLKVKIIAYNKDIDNLKILSMMYDLKKYW